MTQPIDIDIVIDIAVQAGKEILDVYDHGFDVEYKGDGSPLTEADQRAHRLIEDQLQLHFPDIPVLSEESAEGAFENRREWKRFWLVDPLDGTKEFVKRNGEFTVNIALIEDGQPIMGVVHTPVQQITHAGTVSVGAFKLDRDGRRNEIKARTFSVSAAVMVASRSHAGPAVQAFRQRLEAKVGNVEITSMGSSLKMCLIAEGLADIYPRLGPTSEWDTGAAHAVLKAAGGRICDLQGAELRYNKVDILNPWFLAIADTQENWPELAVGLKEEAF